MNEISSVELWTPNNLFHDKMEWEKHCLIYQEIALNRFMTGGCFEQYIYRSPGGCKKNSSILQLPKNILFGSLARGSENNDSDIDLLIVKNSVKKRPFRTREIFEAVRDLE